MPKGQRDYSQVRIAQHALDRYIERFWVGEASDREGAEGALRAALRRAKRLGRNNGNGAVAALGACGDRMLIAIMQDRVCTTVLTWPQFAPSLADFGRARLPRKPKRMLQRLRAPDPGIGTA